MNYNIIRNTDYTPTYWSGGMATELITYPASSSFANRDFLWRLGFAKIDIDASNFSSLPDIKRHLMVTRGEMTLTHKDRYSKSLKPFDQDFFMGDWTTSTEGRCSVFNLMARKDYDGILQHLQLEPKSSINFTYTIDDNKELVAICLHPLDGNFKTNINNNSFEVFSQDLLIIECNSVVSFNNINLVNIDNTVTNIIASIITKNI